MSELTTSSGRPLGPGPGDRESDRRVFRWAAWVFMAATFVTLLPLWLPMLLAAWFAHLVDPVVNRLERALGGRRAWAAWIVVLGMLLLLVPITILMASLIGSAVSFGRRIMESPEWRNALEAIVSESAGAPPTPAGEVKEGMSVTALAEPKRITELIREHGTVAVGFLSKFFGATGEIVVKVFVFFLAAYAFVLDGARQWSWARTHMPLDARHMDRLRAAFHETGQGLVVGVGLTCAAQALVATVAYLALGVPRAFLLGALTFFAAFIPSFGSGLVWVPIAIGLAFTGQTVKAIILVAIGFAIIGTIDNILRPVFSRWGSLDLPVWVLIVSIFGGFMFFGAWGFVLGPLIIRMTKEALDIASEERGFAGD
jgi:predicted PurR-regulated permease PerM